MAFIRFLLFAYLTGAVLTELRAPFDLTLLTAVIVGAIGAWLTEPKAKGEAADPHNLHVRVTSLEHDLWKTQQRVVQLEGLLARVAVPPVGLVSTPRPLTPEPSSDATPPPLAPPTAPLGADPTDAAPTSLPDPEPVAPVHETPSHVDASSPWRFFVGENAAVRIGILVLLLGLGFLLKYVADQGLFPPVVRLGVAAAAGAGLLGLGLFLRRRRRLYGLALLGGGFATLFLCVYASQAILGLVDVGTAKLGYVGLSAAFLVTALVLAEESLAILAVVGALGAPFLGRSGGGYENLLAYDAVMAVVTFTIALRFDYRLLPKIAALLTYGGLGIAAGVVATTQPPGLVSVLSLAAVTLAYSGLPIASALLGRDGNAAILVIGAPVASLGVATVLYGTGWDSAALRFGTGQALFAIASAGLLWRRTPVLAHGQALVAFGLTALVMRHYMGQSPATIAWAVEAVGAVYLGLHQKDRFVTAFGVVLATILMAHFGWPPRCAGASMIPFWNGDFVASLACGAAPLVIGALLHRRPSVPLAGPGGVALALAGLIHLAITVGVQARYPGWTGGGQLSATLFGASALALIAELLGSAARAAPDFATTPLTRQGTFGTLRDAAMVLSVVALPFTALDLVLAPPGSGLTLAAHVTALGVSAFVIVRREAVGWLSATSHLLTIATLALLPAGALRVIAPNYPSLVTAFGVLALAGVALGWAQSTLLRSLLIPAAPGPDPLADVSAQKRIAAVTTGGLLVILGGALLRLAFGESGNTPPLPYLPVVGLVDLSLALSLWAAFRMTAAMDALGSPGTAREARVGVGLLGLVLIASVLARAVAHYGELAFAPSLLRSTVYQASLSLTYGLIGLAVMIVGTRKVSRAAYIFGASLLGLVVVKLLVVDLASSGTLARIVSFIGTGLILLVVGYFVPLPPKR